jgi:hypothetical protein
VSKQSGAVQQEIERLLEITRADEENFLVITYTIGFLVDSPQATPAVCPRLKELEERYRPCLEQGSDPTCFGFGASVRTLSEKLHCPSWKAASGE